MNNTFFSPLVPIPQYIMNDIIRHFKLLNCLFFQIYANYRYQGGSMYKVGWFLPITLQKWEVYALWNDLVKCLKFFPYLWNTKTHIVFCFSFRATLFFPYECPACSNFLGGLSWEWCNTKKMTITHMNLLKF